MKGARALTQMECDAIKSVLPLRDRCVFIIGIRVGFRISEILSLNIHDVNGDVIRIHKRNTKGKIEGRVMPMHIEIRGVVGELLQWHREQVGEIVNEHTPLFLSIGRQRLGYNDFNNSLYRACARVGIPTERVSSHSLRKTFAANMYAAVGGNLLKMQTLLGHKSIDSTVKYLSVDESELMELVKSAK